MKHIIAALAFFVLASGFPSHAGALPLLSKKEEEPEITVPEPEGNLKYTISVTKFENRAGWHGQWDLGDAFGAIMTDTLQQTGWFNVLGETDMREAAMDEQDLAASGRMAGGKKAPKVGRMTPAELLVKGNITHVQESTTGGSGGIGYKGISVGGAIDHAEINITIYLVDSETGQVKASKSIVGKSGRKGLGLGYHGSKLGGLTGDIEAFKKDNVGKATEHAIAQATVFLINQLEEIPWEGSVVLASADKIIINRGTREGVEVGNKFIVGTAEEIVDPDTGEVLAEDVTEVGTIEVTEVKEKIAYCKMTDGDASKVDKGMTIHPK
jgi:curli biogenesis system outer membrane secretion channel CsgG